MARKRKFTWIPFDTEVAWGASVDEAIVATAVLTFGEDFYLHAVKATWSIHGHTATEGPLDVGFAHGDLSIAEIGEALVAELTDPDDIIARERARRPVRSVGTFPGLATEETLNQGEPIYRAARFTVGNDHSVKLWGVNRSGATLTTGTLTNVSGHLVGRFIR